VIQHATGDFAFYVVLTEMPTYFKSAFNFDLESNGFISSLPYITKALFNFSFAAIALKCLKNKWASLQVVRKSCNTISKFKQLYSITILTYTYTQGSPPFGATKILADGNNR